MKGWLRWFLVYTAAMLFVVAVMPWFGWYIHLIWRAFDFGWGA